MADRSKTKERTSTIVTEILNGRSHRSIVVEYSDKWGIGWRSMYRYVKLAEKEIKLHYQKSNKMKIEWHIVNRFRLFASAKDNGELMTALHILKDLGMLQGLYDQLGTDDKPLKHIIEIIKDNKEPETLELT